MPLLNNLLRSRVALSRLAAEVTGSEWQWLNATDATILLRKIC